MPGTVDTRSGASVAHMSNWRIFLSAFSKARPTQVGGVEECIFVFAALASLRLAAPHSLLAASAG